MAWSIAGRVMFAGLLTAFIAAVRPAGALEPTPETHCLF